MLSDFAFRRGNPAIDLAELRLPSGEYANKFSLLCVLSDAGLPVARIITTEELEDMAEQGRRKEMKDPDAYRGEHWKYEAYRRGYWEEEEGWIDSWAVDTLPSQAVGSRDADDRARQIIEESAENKLLRKYLRCNFDISAPRPASFLQAAIDPGALYVSTWQYSDYVFMTMTRPGSRGGIDSCFTKEGEFVGGYDAGIKELNELLFPLHDEATRVLNDQLAASLRYKIDYLFPYDSLYILQARAASRQLSDADEYLRVLNLQACGVPVIELDLGQIRHLRSDEPFILSLKNTEHLGDPYLNHIQNLDLSNMQGLILPAHLEGGLLRHHGYIFIAYALYWGLPVAVGGSVISF